MGESRSLHESPSSTTNPVGIMRADPRAVAGLRQHFSELWSGHPDLAHACHFFHIAKRDRGERLNKCMKFKFAFLSPNRAFISGCVCLCIFLWLRAFAIVDLQSKTDECKTAL